MKSITELNEAKSAIAVRNALSKSGNHGQSSLLSLLLTGSLVILSPSAASQTLTRTVAPTKTLTTTVTPSKTAITTVTPTKQVIVKDNTVAVRVSELQKLTVNLTAQKDALALNTRSSSASLKTIQEEFAKTTAEIQSIQKTRIRLVPQLKALDASLVKHANSIKTLLSEAESNTGQIEKISLSVESHAAETQKFISSVKEPTADLKTLQSSVETLTADTKTLQAEQIKSIEAIKLLQTDIVKYQQILTTEALAVNNPITSAANVVTAADEIAVVELSEHISDVDGDADLATIDLNPLTEGIQKSFATKAGEWTVTETGSLTMNPSLTFEGETLISYTVMDTGGRISDAANVTVVVSGASPVASPVTIKANHDSIVNANLSNSVSDANNDIVISAVDLDPSSKGVQSELVSNEFDPVTEFEGIASILYTVQDDDGNVSNTADISVTVAGAVPIATNVLASTSESKTTVDLSSNVSDPNNDLLISSIDLDPSTKGIQKSLSTAAGVWNVTEAGIVSFTPLPEFEGKAVISYTVQDDDGNTSAPASLTIDVAGATPVATPEFLSTESGTPATAELSDNVSDANNDIVISSIDLDPGTKDVTKSISTTAGVWSVSETGTLTFTPASGFEGEASIVYTVKDDDGNTSAPAQLLVNVAGATPIAIAESFNAAADTIATTDLSDNLSDANNDIVLSSIDLDPATRVLKASRQSPTLLKMMMETCRWPPLLRLQ